ncbi:hypothetical protein ACFSKM_21930 [Ancylobacter dichloromethanicus]
MSKTFNVALAALAAERGRLDLDAPLEKGSPAAHRHRLRRAHPH